MSIANQFLNILATVFPLKQVEAMAIYFALQSLEYVSR